MEENKTRGNQDKQNTGSEQKNIPPDQKIEGRLYGSKNPEFNKDDPKDDISHVDQQEGYMNPGTTGGNAEGSSQRAEK